jgi:outer membrane protein insertion porin family
MLILPPHRRSWRELIRFCALVVVSALVIGFGNPLIESASAAPLDAKPAGFEIAGVQVRGNQRIDENAIVQLLTHRSGRVTNAQISADIKILYQTGFFDQVSASLVDGPGGGRVLQYQVTEKPVVRRVFVKGNKEVPQSELGNVFKFDARRFFDRTKVNQMIRKAVSIYQGRGFYDAAFDYSVLPVGDNQVDLTFTVSEGERFRVREVRITGLSVVDEDEILELLQTKEYRWWNSWLFGTGRLNVEAAKADQLRIRQFLLDNGLIDGVVSAPRIERRDDGLYVSYEVTEGPQYLVGEIRASGDLIDNSQEKTIEGLRSATGEVFSATKVREDSFTVSEKFSDRGFAFANVVPRTSINRSEKTVALDFSTTQGNFTTVNRINISGNDKTYDRVIRREMRVAEQEPFSGSKVRRSQEVLQRLGYFEEINIGTEPVGNDKVDLNVSVREGATGSFSAGAGYSTGDGVLLNARLSENNFLGTGRRAVLNLDIGTRADSYVITLQDRRINDSFWSGGIDLFRTFREYRDFDRRVTGGALTVGYPLEEIFESKVLMDTAFDLKYQYLEAEISNVDLESAAQLVIDSEGLTRESSLTPRLVRNTINNPLNPRSGSRQEVAITVAGAGGNQEFYLIELEQTLYHPLWETTRGEVVFSWRTRFGYGETFDDEDFPLYKRYFPGGINSVRGYDNRSLGPTDEQGNEYGGSKQLVNNLELIFPLVSSAGLKGVVFYDVGEAFDDNESIDLGALRQAYGFGFRWSSPLGPIRIEFGIPIDREEGEESFQTQFSFGAPL